MSRKQTKKKPDWGVLFLGGVLLTYGILFLVTPVKASLALHISSKILLRMIVPLALVFALMTFLNLFLKPAHIIAFIGKGSGFPGILLASAAGILSAGPIYAWYPLLEELRKKGCRDAIIAVFLGNRAVKPFLLPVIISYFGWIYVLLLTLFTIMGSWAVGYLTETFSDAHEQ